MAYIGSKSECYFFGEKKRRTRRRGRENSPVASGRTAMGSQVNAFWSSLQCSRGNDNGEGNILALFFPLVVYAFLSGAAHTLLVVSPCDSISVG